jgi:anti-sigma factor RsiW
MMAETSSRINDEQLLLHALADGELDAATALALERRIAADPALAAEFDLVMVLKEKVARLDQPAVSAELYARIAALAGPQAAATLPVSKHRLAFFEGWRAIAASVVVTAFLASSAIFLLDGRHAGFSMEDAVAGSHRRSLLAANPVDIASSDRHTVKPWLDSKLGISPPATDLATLGYPLIGGRVDVLGSNTVPTLVYRHNEHLITVLAVPGSHSETTPTVEFAGGYNMVRWTGGGFSFWAVSDLEPGELRAFVTEYRSN